MVCLMVITQMLAQTETQKKGRVIVVADMESRRPISDVLVYLDNGDHVKLDWTCRFRLYHYKFKRATFSHPDYLKRVMTNEELNVDTVFLIPLCQTLSEVIVTAKAPQISPQISNSIRQEVATHGVKPSGKDFLSVLRPKDRKRKKLGKKTLEALENY
jgi:hypothetical protein